MTNEKKFQTLLGVAYAPTDVATIAPTTTGIESYLQYPSAYVEINTWDEEREPITVLRWMPLSQIDTDTVINHVRRVQASQVTFNRLAEFSKNIMEGGLTSFPPEIFELVEAVDSWHTQPDEETGQALLQKINEAMSTEGQSF